MQNKHTPVEASKEFSSKFSSRFGRIAELADAGRDKLYGTELAHLESDIMHYVQSQADQYEKVREQERIICAAVRASDGYVFRGQWHATAMYAPFGLQGMPKYKDEKPHGDDQGFITSTERYVTREEAWEIAKAAGQLNSRPHQEGELYSEDLMYAEPLLLKSTV